AMLPRADLPEVILEVMTWIPAFTAAFTSASGGRTRLDDLHVSVAACLTAQALNIGYVPVPPLRKPGSAWTELPRPANAGAAPAGHVRIGYARASTIRQSLDTQADSLSASGVTRIFAEKISTRAVTLAREIRAAPGRTHYRDWSFRCTSAPASFQADRG
ncbi:MAG: hypothetical protein ACRDNF_01130, partial [Streptosporangiaceae bacterium]